MNKRTEKKEEQKVLPWIVVLLLCINGKIVLIKDMQGRYVLPRKEGGGSQAQNLEFSYEDTIEKIIRDNKIEHGNIKGIQILGDKKIYHPEARKIFVQLEVENGKIMSPQSSAGLYFPKDILELPSKEEDKKIVTQYFKICYKRAS